MPKLPDTYGKRPAPSFGRPYQLAPVVEDKGVGQGLQALGAGLVDFDASMKKAQARDDNFAIIDRATQLEAWMLQDRAGKDGWSHIKAGNVTTDLIPQAYTRFKSKVEELSGSLANDVQREGFARRAALASNRNKSNLFNHVTKEKSVAYKNAYEASVKLGLESVVVNWKNENNEIGIILETLKDSTVAMAEEMGVVGDELILAQKEISSAVHAKVIGEAVDNNESKYAAHWLKHNRKNMIDRDIDDAEKAIEDGNLREESQAYAEDVKDKGLTETQALAKTRKELSGALEDEAVKRVKALYGEDDAEQKRIWDDNGATARGIYAQAIDDNLSPQDAYDKIPPSVLRDMKPSERMALQRAKDIAAKDGKKPPDFELFAQFETLLEQGDIKDKSDVLAFEPGLSDAQNRTAMKAFNKAGSLKVTEMKRAFRDVINKTQSNFSGKDELQWRAYQEFMLDRVEDTRRPGDLAKWTDEWIMEGSTTEDWWFTDDPDTFGEFITAQKFKGRKDEFNLDVPDVDKSSVEFVRRVAKSFDQLPVFYTNIYRPAVEYLTAHDINVNNRSIAAIAILPSKGLPITAGNIQFALDNAEELNGN